ncbi:PREDICTED: inositol polyphosphate multikinase [Ceratosolen solmsi marchali]|uniref:Kinase n=1 Tax=Ceratosolen solmsi marchali TaxID=326594 RepID=A0AAJ7E1M0_9HYME|nr:PREDICTED: inositol polyphosphate multikinase [Ceratosolen solmsi marchali]
MDSETRLPRGLLPDGTAHLDTQVGGHPFDAKTGRIGMLRGPSGRVFKPLVNSTLAEREIAFYENLRVSGNPTDTKMLRYTPTYHGTKELRIFDRRMRFIELEDITDGMSEPCVMDVKIGRRTWDPLAGPAKRASEELKYADSKRAYGFCIPGFQVYRIPAGTLGKYDKDYGKRLDTQTTVEALSTFLNATPGRPPCRELVVRLLSVLWKILALFREQRRYRLYSSSLLIAYDARRLRHLARRQLNDSPAESLLRAPVSRSRSSGAARSLGSLNRIGQSPASPGPGSESPTRSPRVNRTIDRLQRLKRSISLQNCEVLPERSSIEITSIAETTATPRRPLDVQVHKLCRTHSYSNNFDADIVQMKEDYAALLSELSSTCEEKQNWVRVYMIDFAHVFPADDGDLDSNYLEGIENLIKILEKFLA